MSSSSTVDETPSLQKQCDDVRDNFFSQVSEEALIEMKKFSEDMRSTRIADLAVQQPHSAPNFELPDQHGNMVSLKELCAQGPVVISFYRGSWCPFCNLELMALQAHSKEIKAKGASMIAISPMLPDYSKKNADEKGFDFPILSDVGNKVAKLFKLVFKVDDALHFFYDGWGCKVPAYNGDSSWELPLPATYVIDKESKITFSAIDSDYVKRCEPKDIIAALPDKQKEDKLLESSSSRTNDTKEQAKLVKTVLRMRGVKAILPRLFKRKV